LEVTDQARNTSRTEPHGSHKFSMRFGAFLEQGEELLEVLC
jgi:hypothetical protein